MFLFLHFVFPNKYVFLLLYLYLQQFFSSVCRRLFGLIGVIRTNSSERHSLGLHSDVCWPDFVNPFVLLLLYYTLVALLHKWVHITDEVC